MPPRNDKSERTQAISPISGLGRIKARVCSKARKKAESLVNPAKVRRLAKDDVKQVCSISRPHVVRGCCKKDGKAYLNWKSLTNAEVVHTSQCTGVVSSLHVFYEEFKLLTVPHWL